MSFGEILVLFVATFGGVYLTIDRICTSFERICTTKALGECYKNNAPMLEKELKKQKNG